MRARTRHLGTLGAAMLAAACAPKQVRQSPDPATARRFEIIGVSDTTFRFALRGATWVRAGQPGIAVDPRRHDVLVARYVVQGTLGDTATAVVTGQTTDLTPAHVALLTAPTQSAMRQRTFWWGFVSGGFLATVAAAIASR